MSTTVPAPAPAPPGRRPHYSCHLLPAQADTGSWVMLERLGDALAPRLQWGEQVLAKGCN